MLSWLTAATNGMHWILRTQSVSRRFKTNLWWTFVAFYIFLFLSVFCTFSQRANPVESHFKPTAAYSISFTLARCTAVIITGLSSSLWVRNGRQRLIFNISWVKTENVWIHFITRMAAHLFLVFLSCTMSPSSSPSHSTLSRTMLRCECVRACSECAHTCWVRGSFRIKHNQQCFGVVCVCACVRHLLVT